MASIDSPPLFHPHLKYTVYTSGNIDILGKQNVLFSSGPVVKCLLLNFNVLVIFHSSTHNLSVFTIFIFPIIHFVLTLPNFTFALSSISLGTTVIPRSI